MCVLKRWRVLCRRMFVCLHKQTLQGDACQDYIMLKQDYVKHRNTVSSNINTQTCFTPRLCDYDQFFGHLCEMLT